MDCACKNRQLSDLDVLVKSVIQVPAGIGKTKNTVTFWVNARYCFSVSKFPYKKQDCWLQKRGRRRKKDSPNHPATSGLAQNESAEGEKGICTRGVPPSS